MHSVKEKEKQQQSCLRAEKDPDAELAHWVLHVNAFEGVLAKVRLVIPELAEVVIIRDSVVLKATAFSHGQVFAWKKDQIKLQIKLDYFSCQPLLPLLHTTVHISRLKDVACSIEVSPKSASFQSKFF